MLKCVVPQTTDFFIFNYALRLQFHMPASCCSSQSCPQIVTPKIILKCNARRKSKTTGFKVSLNNNLKRMFTSNFQHSNFPDDLEICRMEMERFLVVGLGNYINPSTRHSVGMMAMDSLMHRLGSQWEKSRICEGILGKSLITKEGETVAAELYLFKPQTLMNINGKSVLKAAKHLDITADKIYLIHDELDKAVGKCGIKDGGSARGHKGVISCYDSLRPSPLWPKSTNDDFKGMTRLQIGIGRPASQSQIVSYVLSRFHDEELEKIETAINNGLDLMLKCIMSRIFS